VTFHAGEVWRYHTRPSEPDSIVIIVRVDEEPESGTVVHVFVDGLRVRNPRHPEGFSGAISHMPFTESAMAASVTELLGQADALPPFEEGYESWRSAWDAGEAGVFTITVAEAVEVMEQAING
jgi:hypothetical protein